MRWLILKIKQIVIFIFLFSSLLFAKEEMFSVISNGDTRSYFNSETKIISLENPNDINTYIHELGHYHFYKDTIKWKKVNDFDSSKGNYSLSKNELKLFFRFSFFIASVLENKITVEDNDYQNLSSNLQDFVCCVSYGEIQPQYGHSKEYLLQNEYIRISEIYAECFTIWTMNQVKEKKFLRKNYPEIYRNFDIYFNELYLLDKEQRRRNDKIF